MTERTLVNGQEVTDYPEIPPETERGTVLRITEVGEDVLHTPCETITEFGTDELRTLIDDMFATMAVAEGVGLAATQVDRNIRLFVYDLSEDGVRHVGHVLNPVLTIHQEEGTTEGEEGCLSVPGPGASLFRATSASVTGVDVDGNPVELSGVGYFARMLQHETDHLDGRLYIDLISKRERKRVISEMLEYRPEVLQRRKDLSDALGKDAAEYPETAPLDK